jgi:hypothetical protein
MTTRLTRPVVDRRRALIRIAAAALAIGLTAGCAVASGPPPAANALQLAVAKPGSDPRAVANDDDDGLLGFIELADCIRINGLPEYPVPDPVTGDLGLTDLEAAALKQDPRLALAMLLCINIGGGGTIGG